MWNNDACIFLTKVIFIVKNQRKKKNFEFPSH